MDKLIPYSIGIVSMSVCVEKDLTIEEIEQLANDIQPTGISSKWTVAKNNFKYRYII